MEIRPGVTAVLAVGVTLAACGDDGTGPTAAACPPGATSVEADVDAGGSVTFDWSPACGVALLLVEPVGSGSDQWGLGTPEESWEDPDEANRIVPPITYGVVPPGPATAPMAPEPLVPGASYELILWRIVPFAEGEACIQRFDEACLVAVEVFTR